MKMTRLEWSNFGFGGENPEYFVTSQWQNDAKPSVRYLIYRIVLACYFVFVFVLSLITANECGQLSFYAIYLTNWNVVLNTVSTVFAAVVVTLYYTKKITIEENEIPMLFKVYWLLTVLSTSVSLAVSSTYWPSYSGRDEGLNDVLTHAGNSLVLLIDTFIVAHPPRFSHFIYPMAFGMFYLFVFSLPYTLLGGVNRDFKNYIYPSIDWSNKTSGALKFSIIVIAVVTAMHFVVTGLIMLRVLVARKIKK